MNGHKDFDCVRMKWEIQQRLLNEFHGMNRDEAERTQQQRISADPLLGPFLQKVAASGIQPARSHK
jgi:hypothetical protein